MFVKHHWCFNSLTEQLRAVTAVNNATKAANEKLQSSLLELELRLRRQAERHNELQRSLQFKSHDPSKL
jgi:ribosomal protein RSM22 (predicted rRNA methylase)